MNLTILAVVGLLVVAASGRPWQDHLVAPLGAVIALAGTISLNRDWHDAVPATFDWKTR